MTLILENVSIDRLDDIVFEHNNTYHSTIKIKPLHILMLIKKLIIKILNFKFVIMKEFQNTKAFLLKVN